MRAAVAVAAVAVLLAGDAARADEMILTGIGLHITTPDGWKRSPDTAEPLVARLRDDAHEAGGLAWVGKTGALFVLWRTTREPVTGDLTAAVDAALDGFLARGGTVLRSSRAIGEWDATAFVDVEPERGTLVLARASVYVAHDGRLREIRAECALRKEQLGEARKACETALGSFALVVDDAELSRIKAPDAGPIVPDAAPAAAPPSAPAAAPAGVPPAPPAPRIAPARPWWAGPGIVLVVVLLPVLAFFGYRLLKDLRK